MIRINFEVSKQEGLTAWQVAPAVRFHCYEHGVNLFKRLGIVKLEYPAFLRCIVLIKDTEVQCLLFVRAASPPRLERADVLDSNLLIQIVSVKDQRLPFRIENAAIWFLRRSITRDVVYLRDVQVSRSHQIPNVAVVGKKFVLLVNRLFPIAKLARKVSDLRFEARVTHLFFRALLSRGVKLCLHLLECGLSRIEFLRDILS